MSKFTVPVDVSGSVAGVDFEFEAGTYDPKPGSPEFEALSYLERAGVLGKLKAPKTTAAPAAKKTTSTKSTKKE